MTGHALDSVEVEQVRIVLEIHTNLIAVLNHRESQVKFRGAVVNFYRVNREIRDFRRLRHLGLIRKHHLKERRMGNIALQP